MYYNMSQRNQPDRNSGNFLRILSTLFFLVLCSVLASCEPPLVRLDIPKPDLPDRVIFRTPNESFNQEYFVALREGRIWVKPNTDVHPAKQADWHLLGQTGLPEGKNLVRFVPPERVVEISADGLHLHALSDLGIFYRGDNLNSESHVEGWFNWTDKWGWPMGKGDGLTQEWETKGWSVSDSHPFEVDHYEDPNGTEHSVGMGVAHHYRLGPDGYRIHFNDWWLPNDWSREICGPDRGTFNAINLSTSASTLFIIGAGGELYTRLYDFDTSGENNLLTYSYIIDGDHGTTRRLPAEPWQRQPDIDGELTSKITIFQNGEGNAARILRVEGIKDNQPGFFYKHIYDDQWQFEATGIPVSEQTLNRSDEPPVPPEPEDYPFMGTLSQDDKALELELIDFNMICSPARARLSVDGQPLTVNGEILELEFHHVHTLVKKARETRYWLNGNAAEIKAALILPDTWDNLDDSILRDLVTEIFNKRQVVNFLGTATTQSITLEEIPWYTPFRCPAREKPMTDFINVSLEAK